MSEDAGDAIARMVLAIVQDIRRRQQCGDPRLPTRGVEPTGIYVDRDVRDAVYRRAS